MSKKSKNHRKKHSKKHKKIKKEKHVSEADSTSDSVLTSSADQWVEKNNSRRTMETKRDDWMAEEIFVPTYSLRQLKEKKNSEKQSKIDKTLLDKPGHSDRELNPYWTNNGTGLPLQKDYSSGLYTSAEWLKKALRRLQEKAEEENISLESVATERFGSLKNLYNMIAEAEGRDSKSNYRNCDSFHSAKLSAMFMRPSNDSIKQSAAVSTKTGKGWKRKEKPDEIESLSEPEKILSSTDNTLPVLSNEEMNSLASKLVKAELMGNQNQITAIKTKLEAARKARENVNKDHETDNRVILTQTNMLGYSQPLKSKRDNLEQKKRKYETHIDGKRVKYFEDDDKYSLHQMFEREQVTSTADSNLEFIHLSAQIKKYKSDDLVDLNMEQSTSNRTQKNNDVQKAINNHHKTERTLKSCFWCLTNNKLFKHLVISTKSKAYLCVPQYQSLIEGHCLIVPTNHATCSTLLDEDIWEQVLDYCKKLTQMFRKNGQDTVFFEYAMNFHHYPHTIIHCIPMPVEVSNLAPIYFKKALIECESEWSENKKLVNVNRMDVRRVIPKGLPYFFVHFGLDNGYAHVIEDEKLFPRNFAQEIIGGMIDLDHRIWRKPRIDDVQTQCKKVNRFNSLWKSIQA